MLLERPSLPPSPDFLHDNGSPLIREFNSSLHSNAICETFLSTDCSLTHVQKERGERGGEKRRRLAGVGDDKELLFASPNVNCKFLTFPKNRLRCSAQRKKNIGGKNKISMTHLLMMIYNSF